jgi:hypothetical protein
VSKPQQQAASQVVLKAAVAHQELQRRLALGETDVLERCPLIESRRDQDDCAEKLLAIAIRESSKAARSITHWSKVAASEKPLQARR